MTTYKQERVGDYIQTHSGKRFYPLDPHRNDINTIDVAHSLSNLCRFTGHSERFYSVAEHSIYCAKIARKLGLSLKLQLYALLHDASESVVNDLARPIKQNVPQYIDLEDKVMDVMWGVFGLVAPTQDEYLIIKTIDNTMLVNEMEQLMNRSDIPQNIDKYPVFIDLSSGYNAGEAKLDFIEAYMNLMIMHIEEENYKKAYSEYASKGGIL